MVKKLVLFVVVSIAFVGGSSLQAGWFGNPGSTLRQGQSSIQGIIDTGETEVEMSRFDLDLERHRFYLQYNHGLAHGFNIFGRAMPLTGKVDFDFGDDVNIWGLGGGARWSPDAQSTPLRFGGQAAFDWSRGDEDGTDIDIKEFSIAGGAGYPVAHNVNLYGGLSLIALDLSVETSGGSADYDIDNPFGLFFGLEISPVEAWTLGFEMHMINEQMFGFQGGYRF